MNNKRKKIIASGVILAATVLTYIFTLTTGFKCQYGNKITEYITTDAGRKAEVAWLVKCGTNADDLYGMDQYVKTKSNWSNIAAFNLLCARNKIAVGFSYSSVAFLPSLDAYQKSVSDSCKFQFLTSEEEQYNSFPRAQFYSDIKTVGDYCVAHSMKSFCYQGWPSQTDCDSIVRHCNGVFLHAYIVYDSPANIGNIGGAIFGYIKSLLSLFANSESKFSPGNKFQTAIILSCENPDQTKTQFGYHEFINHTWDDCYSGVPTYFTLHADANVSRSITLIGRVGFVEDQYKVSHR